MADSVSPFTGARTGYQGLSTSLNEQSQSLVNVEMPGSGQMVSALNERVEKSALVLAALASKASDTEEACEKQEGYDLTLISNGASTDKINELLDKVAQTERGMREGTNTAQDQKDAVAAYKEAKESQKTARETHVTQTEGTSFPEVEVDDVIPKSKESPNAPGSPGDPSDNTSTDGSDVEDDKKPGDTELSSDSGTPSQQPQQSLSQPQQTAQQPQQAMQQPSMSPTAMTQPQMPQVRDSSKDDKKKEDKLDFAKVEDTNVGTKTSVDDPLRGSSITATTRSDVSGQSPSAVSATGVRPGENTQQQMMRGGGMGGGMMGGMGHGQGQGKGAKERPVILSEDPEQIGKDSTDQAVQTGLIGRDSSKPAEK